MKGVPECLTPSQGGYLELSAELLQRLVITEPIEKFYEVEDEPFARGKYAAVRRCREKTSGRQFAAKYLRKRNHSKDHRNEILHEVAVLEACRPCKRVVNLHQVFESTNEMILLLELACGGELQMLLDSDDLPSEGQVQTFMKQIMEGITYLHSINVAHLDIKPQNLVMTGNFPECEVKLCDLGISRYLSQGADVREILGTPDYIAPEVLNYEPISLSTDMWSVGVLLYVLLTGCSPFGGDTKQETFCNISQCRLEFPDDLFEEISEEAKDLMTKLMVKIPGERLSAKKCLEHSWFMKNFKPSTPLPTKTPEAAPRLKLQIPETLPTPVMKTTEPTLENINNNNNTINKNNNKTHRGLRDERKIQLKSNLANLVSRLDNDSKLNRVDSFSRNRASGMQTLPTIRFNNNINIESTIFKFQRAIIIDEDEGLPPSPISTDNSSISDSNSDTVSEMSIDSSSDRSSIISLDDSLDYPYRLRHYSSCANIWEAARNQRPTMRQWPPKECNNSFVKAMSRFRTEPKPKLAIYNSEQQRKSIGLDIVRENGNLVVIREHKAVNDRYAKTSELKCESVRSKIRKFQILRPESELNNVF